MTSVSGHERRKSSHKTVGADPPMVYGEVMERFTIRWARCGDGPVLHGLIEALAIYEKAPDAVKNTAARLDEQLGMDQPPFECLLAEASDRTPMGFALFFHTYSTWEGVQGIHLEDLFVVPGARRLGVGRAFLAHLTRLTLERGCARLEWSVLHWNRLALDFYDALGAETLSQWRNQRLSGAALTRVADHGRAAHGWTGEGLASKP